MSNQLNISPYFETALWCLDDTKLDLSVKLLPLVVLSAQDDLINHFKHALNHYFPISLDVQYLQNSSIGTPYQKWAKFTNDDFVLFDYSFWLFVQAGSRLWHEKFTRNQMDTIKISGRYDEDEKINLDSNIYTGLICKKKFNGASIGVEILSNNQMVFKCLNWRGGSPEIDTLVFELSNRDIILDIHKCIMLELPKLEDLNYKFREQCRKYVTDNDIFFKHDNIHESYWTINDERQRPAR